MQSKLPTIGSSIFSKMSQMAHQYDAVNLSQGFPNFDCDEVLKDLVHQAMATGKNQYAPLSGVRSLCERLSEKCQALYGRAFHPQSEITITSGATQALFTSIQALVHRGDEVIIIEPAYDLYRPAIELVGAKVVAYPLVAPDFAIDWNAFGQLISDKTRMIIVNTPHNPTGQLFSALDWKALYTLVEHTNILIMSDEAYEHLTFDGWKHESILKYPEFWNRTIAVFSFGKTLNATGWKMGYCIAPKAIMWEIQKVHQFVTFCVNRPIQHAIAHYFEDPETYLHMPAFYEQKRNLFQNAMAKTALKPIPTLGTYFQCYDYAHLSELDDVAYSKYLTEHFGVATIPISVFYGQPPKDQRILRFCFAKTDDLLVEAAERLEKLQS